MKHTDNQTKNRRERRAALVTPARASLVYTLSSLVGKSSSVFTLPLFTRILSPEELGLYTLYMSVLGLCSVTLSVWYSGNATYKGIISFKAREWEYISSSFGLYIIFSLLTLLGLFLFRFALGISLAFVFLIYLQLLLDGAVGLYLTSLRSRYEYRLSTVLTLMLALLPPLASIILIRVFSFGIYGRIFGLLSVSLAVGIPIIILLLGRSPKIYDRELWRFSLSHALPLLPQGIASALSHECDKLVISASLGAAALAKYSVAHSLGGSLSFLTVGAGYALSPWIMRKLDSNDTGRASRVSVLLLRIMGAATVFLVALSPELMRLLAPRGYSVATVAVLPIALSVIPSFFSSNASSAIVHRGRSGAVTLSSLTGAAVNVLLSFLLIPRLSYLGAGLALLFSLSASAFLTAVIMKREDIPELIPRKALAVTLAFSGALSGVALLLYNYAAARIMLLIPPALTALSALFSLKELVLEKKDTKLA